MYTPSIYRRPLPEGQIAFASPEGRGLFREALAAGTLESFYPLIEQFHTQADPAFCGLASLVVTLNALGIDPGRLWRGPWRWFSEELLDCCTPLETVRETGVSIQQLACVARCNGAETRVVHPEQTSVAGFREVIERSARSPGDDFVIAAYARNDLGQTGSGHFSPIGGYHQERDLVLILDVARFKYPPHWVPLDRLFEAMRARDPASGRSRGWVELRCHGSPSSMAYFITCRRGTGIGSTLLELIEDTRRSLRGARPSDARSALRQAGKAASLSSLADAIEVRAGLTAEHAHLLETLRAALFATDVYRVLESAGVEAVELAAAWLLAAPAELWADLDRSVEREVRALIDGALARDELAKEIRLVRRQIEFVLDYARTDLASAPLTSASL